jgi:hypothetical protein
MPSEGFSIDWDGSLRSIGDPGGGYSCEVDSVARWVAIKGKGDALVHEVPFYKTIDDVSKAGIKATLVPGSHPWGRKADGF